MKIFLVSLTFILCITEGLSGQDSLFYVTGIPYHFFTSDLDVPHQKHQLDSTKYVIRFKADIQTIFKQHAARQLKWDAGVINYVTDAYLKFTPGSYPLRLYASRASFRKSIRHISSAGEEYAFSQSADLSRLLIDLELFDQSFGLRGGLHSNTGYKKKFTGKLFGIFFYPHPRLFLHTQVFDDEVYQQLSMSVQDTSIKVIGIARSVTWQVGFDLTLPNYLELENTLIWKKNIPGGQHSSTEKYLVSEPNEFQSRTTLLWRRTPLLPLILVHHEYLNSGQPGKFVYADQSFGNLLYFDSYLHSVAVKTGFDLAGFQIQSGLSAGHGKHSGGGFIESWPFSETIVDLLGYRFNSKSQLNFDYFRIGLSANSSWHGVIFDGGLEWERIFANGELRSWEPEFLVFGVKNLQIQRLPMERQDGLYAGLHLSKKIWQKLSIHYQFRQYLPLYSRYHTGTPSAADSSADSGRTKTYGGGSHLLQAALLF